MSDSYIVIYHYWDTVLWLMMIIMVFSIMPGRYVLLSVQTGLMW